MEGSPGRLSWDSRGSGRGAGRGGSDGGGAQSLGALHGLTLRGKCSLPVDCTQVQDLPHVAALRLGQQVAGCTDSL